MYIWKDPNLVTIVPADALAPVGAKSSADTVMTKKFTLYVLNF